MDTQSAPPTHRPLVAASWAAAALFAAQAVVQMASPPQSEPFSRPSDHLIEALFLAGLVAVTVAFVTLHRRHRDRPRWGRFGALAAAAGGGGTALLAVAVAATLMTGGTTLGAVFVVGLLAWVLGGILVAIAAYRAGLLPRPVAILFAVAVPLSDVIGEPAGPVAVAVLWGVVAISAGRGGAGSR